MVKCPSIAPSPRCPDIDVSKLVHSITHCQQHNTKCLLIVEELTPWILGCLNITVLAIYGSYTVWKIPVLLKWFRNVYPFSLFGGRFEMVSWHWVSYSLTSLKQLWCLSVNSLLNLSMSNTHTPSSCLAWFMGWVDHLLTVSPLAFLFLLLYIMATARVNSKKFV